MSLDSLHQRPFAEVLGVDFSGAALAGRNIWVARARPDDGRRLKLVRLQSLERLTGFEQREAALTALVGLIRDAHDSLVGIDFPFSLPLEIRKNQPDPWDWAAKFNGPAGDFGRECVRIARTIGDKLHIRRLTDAQTKTPFDCYHYRIIYQTFHGMRDVLRPLKDDPRVCVIPFQYRRASKASCFVVEACPGSTLKRLGLPHNNYKQPAGGTLTDIRRQNRLKIIRALRGSIDITPAQARVMMSNPGGDALDAVVAAVGVWQGFRSVDHRLIANHPRYPFEGMVFA